MSQEMIASMGPTTGTNQLVNPYLRTGQPTTESMMMDNLFKRAGGTPNYSSDPNEAMALARADLMKILGPDFEPPTYQQAPYTGYVPQGAEPRQGGAMHTALQDAYNTGGPIMMPSGGLLDTGSRLPKR